MTFLAMFQNHMEKQKYKEDIWHVF